jgi:hypothetical protein
VLLAYVMAFVLCGGSCLCVFDICNSFWPFVYSLYYLVPLNKNLMFKKKKLHPNILNILNVSN